MRHTLLLLLLLTACQTVTYKKPPTNEPSTDATIQLAEAAISISNSMHEMATVEKVIYPANPKNHQNIPHLTALQTRVSVDWSGPITELVRRVAKAAHFRFNVLGKEPAIPILISVTARDKSLTELLRDIDYQAGNRASILVSGAHHLIELRYENAY